MLRSLKSDPKYCTGREIPEEEFPPFPSALNRNPAEIDNYGHWQMRYRSVTVLWGTGIPLAVLPEVSIRDTAGRLATVVGAPL